MDKLWNSLTPLVSNAWVIGIGASTVSGVIVWVITQKLFSTRENKEYVQKVLSANAEVLYALRPLISESAFPSSEVVSSVIAATSKKFGVKKESMGSPMQFFDELVKEVMDSNFIAPKKKIEYCNHLLLLKQDALSVAQPKADGGDLDPAAIAKRENMFNALSLAVAFMAGFTILFSSFNRSDNGLTLNIFSSIFVPIAAALITSLGALLYSLRVREENGENIFRRILTRFEVEDKEKKL